MKDFIEKHDTTKNILIQHPYATMEDILDFFNEEILGRGKGTLEAAKEIYNLRDNCYLYFDKWYKYNRNKKWYAENREKGLF